MQDLTTISKGFEMDWPQILRIRILIISWPWALLGSRSRIILAISLLLNDIDQVNIFAFFKNVERSLKERSSVKNELNISAFSLKLFWCFKVECKEFFYYSRTSWKLTNRISCWSLDQPNFLIRGSSIFAYYFSIIEYIMLPTL